MRLKKIYYDNIGKFEQLVPLDKIFHSKWLNTTYKLNDITLEIKRSIFKYRKWIADNRRIKYRV